jgi:hypothetical protein
MTVEELSLAILPSEIGSVFNIEKIIEDAESTTFILYEKEELIPKALAGKEVVLDGFCNQLELLHFPHKGKPLYLRLYRRRWKEKGGTEHISNTYHLHDPGMRVTRDFGAFLKAAL